MAGGFPTSRTVTPCGPPRGPRTVPVTVIVCAVTAIVTVFSTPSPLPTTVALDVPGGVPGATVNVTSLSLAPAGTGVAANVAGIPAGRFCADSITSPIEPVRSTVIVAVPVPAIGTFRDEGVALRVKLPDASLTLPHPTPDATDATSETANPMLFTVTA